MYCTFKHLIFIFQMSPLIGPCFFLGLFALMYVVHKIKFIKADKKRRLVKKIESNNFFEEN